MLIEQTLAERRQLVAEYNMLWQIDQQTAKAAMAYRFPFELDVSAPQFQGCKTDARTWNDRVIQPSTWPDEPLCSSPDQIITQFTDGHYTQALALVVSWGGMGRRSKDIYRERARDTIEKIDRTLGSCSENIRASHSIADSWMRLTIPEEGGLAWSAVMTSKTLHFLCRSLGFAYDPPVAIGGAVIRQRLWPVFRNSFAPDQRPGDWEGNSFDAYRRYMSAILTWASRRNWTTTEMEATIFKRFS